MKVLAVNGSPHAAGNTAQALAAVCAELERVGIETEIIHVGGAPLRGCIGCGACDQSGDGRCAFGEADGMNGWIAKAAAADGLLLGSPVHFAGMSGAMKCFLDRLFYAAGRGGSLRHKVGACVSAVRRSGGVPAVDSMMHFLTYSEMLIATTNYWPVVHGTRPGEVAEDAEGQQILRLLGKNMAWLLQLRELGRTTAPELEPAPEKKVSMNFIR